MNSLTLPDGTKLQYLDKLTAEYVVNEIYTENEYLCHGISVKDGDTIFDVGANIGIFSRYALSLAKNLKIYTFEPIPAIFKVLTANLVGYANECRNFNVGLGDKPGDIEFDYYPKVSADSAAVHFDWDYKINKYVENWEGRVVSEQPIARFVPKFLRKFVITRSLKMMYRGVKVICPIWRLSDIIAEENVEKIDLLKVDAENYEWPVLMGIDDGDWAKIQQITMEIHEHIKGGEGLVNRIQDLLESQGFTVVVGEDNIDTCMGVFMLYASRS